MGNVDTDTTIYRASLVKIRQDVPGYVSFGKGTQDCGAQSFQLTWTDFSSHVTPQVSITERVWMLTMFCQGGKGLTLVSPQRIPNDMIVEIKDRKPQSPKLRNPINFTRQYNIVIEFSCLVGVRPSSKHSCMGNSIKDPQLS